EWPPFLFVDEADVEMSTSIYPLLLELLDKGRIGDDKTTLERCVLFWGGGKCGSVEGFRRFLEGRQKTRAYQKGTDLFNRSTFRIDFPSALYRNRNQKLLVGLSRAAELFRLPLHVDSGVISALRGLHLTGGVRDLGTFAARLKQDSDGNIFMTDEAKTGEIIVVRCD